jgi:hypothetical protein
MKDISKCCTCVKKLFLRDKPWYSKIIIFFDIILYSNTMRLFSSILIWKRQWTEYCEKYAKPEDIGAQEEISSDDELSEDGYASSDDGIVGQPDP